MLRETVGLEMIVSFATQNEVFDIEFSRGLSSSSLGIFGRERYGTGVSVGEGG